MRSRSSVVRIRRKVTWGSRWVLSSVVILTLAFVFPLAAHAVPTVKPVTQGRSDVAAQKLDRELRSRLADPAGESDVIVELADRQDDSNVLRGFGIMGKRLAGMNGRVLRIPNALLTKLAAHPRVKRIHHDRPVGSDVARTAVTIGSRAVVSRMGYTGAGVGVAVIDSGITGWHDDLRIRGFGRTQPTSLDLASVSLASTGLTLSTNQRVAHFKDFVNGYTNAYDDWGHGTHVSGIVAGNGFDTIGVREAIAPGAHIISLKALDARGAGTISNVIAAIDYAIATKAQYNIRVLNMSLSAGVTESYHTDPLAQAAKRAVQAGIVVVASAGNMGRAKDGSPQYGAIGSPGNAPWVLTVGASSTGGTTDRRDDVIAPYSSRGPTMYDFAAKPDIVAPDTVPVPLSDPLSRMYVDKAAYLSSGLIGGLNFKPYLSLSGTSMAAPVVSGTVALMLHANPRLTPNMVKAILQFTSEVYPDYDYLTQGAGFINARGAVVLARYFAVGKPGMAYPQMTTWSRHILWGNRRFSGGVLAPNGTAWAQNIVWGDSRTPLGQHIVWGDNCVTDACDTLLWGTSSVWGGTGDDVVWGESDGDNIVWGNVGFDNIVWGDGDTDNIVWGNLGFDNIVWGNDCGGDDCDNIVWGQTGLDNIVWGNAEGIDNIVWGQNDGDNIVWGQSDGDNIVWGNSAEPVDYGDDTVEIDALDPSVWDELFEDTVPEVNETDSSTTPDTTSTDTTMTTSITTETTTATTSLLEGGLQ